MPKLTIESFEDLLTYLRADDLKIKLSVLKAVAAEPQKALAYGHQDGRDVIDELLAQLSDSRETQWVGPLCDTLKEFEDRRIAPAFLREFRQTHSEVDLFALAAHLRRFPEESTRETVLHILCKPPSLEHRRAAATLAAHFDNLRPKEEVLVACYSHAVEVSPPAWQACPNAWHDELLGPRADMARFWLERQGRRTCLAVAKRWEQLDASTQGWLLRWIYPRFGGENLIEFALATPGQQRREALKLLVDHPLPSAASKLRDLWNDPQSDLELKIALVRAGFEEYDLANELKDAPKSLAVELLRRCDTPELALPYCRHPDWQLRAAAAEALSNSQQDTASLVEPLLHSEQLEVRMAAVQILARWRADSGTRRS